ncbi:hypothetical protein LIA77_00656 [Sarocladium implicatum]|nr:hypothetical protein LIA77_00656 [Sarocladium implicatum]
MRREREKREIDKGRGERTAGQGLQGRRMLGRGSSAVAPRTCGNFGWKGVVGWKRGELRARCNKRMMAGWVLEEAPDLPSVSQYLVVIVSVCPRSDASATVDGDEMTRSPMTRATRAKQLGLTPQTMRSLFQPPHQLTGGVNCEIVTLRTINTATSLLRRHGWAAKAWTRSWVARATPSQHSRGSCSVELDDMLRGAVRGGNDDSRCVPEQGWQSLQLSIASSSPDGQCAASPRRRESFSPLAVADQVIPPPKDSSTEYPSHHPRGWHAGSLSFFLAQVYRNGVQAPS